MFKNLVFFNQFHNGDCFVGKGWVRNIMQQLPEMKFFYIHGNHPDIIKDLGCQHVKLNISDRLQADIPENANRVEYCAELGDKNLNFNARTMRMGADDDTIYINTWCGAFQGELFGYHQHSNYIIQHRMYEMYCEQLTQVLGRPITQSNNPHDYLPFINFSYYDIEPANNFLYKEVGNKKLVLLCNGPANSGQSGVGDFKDTLRILAQELPDHVFVATHDVGIVLPNVFYTNNIFNKKSDLNEIAYLSQRSSLIIGKNSGPFSYCCFKNNMEDSSNTFFCFGKSLTDCLNAGLTFPAKFKFCDQTSESLITNILLRELKGMDSNRTGMQHIMV